MDHNDRSTTSPPRHECPRTRLAESPLGAVEVCSCGMWQLHVGVLTLRLTATAVSDLLGLLGEAVAEHAARRFGVARELGLRQERGEA